MLRTLDETVSRRAAEHPESIAVVLNHQRLSYGALEMLANQLARALRAAGCRRGDRVCVLAPKTPLAIVAIIAIYKVGGIYVPLDPSGPAARLAKIVRHCESRFILAAATAGAVLAEFINQDDLPRSLVLGWLDGAPPGWIRHAASFSLDDIRAHSLDPMPHRGRRPDVAHILFTSGSTGTPKGVVIHHANVIHFVEWARKHFGLDTSDRLSGHAPLHFDLSFFDIFGAFHAGAQLHLVPAEASLLPNRLADWMRGSELTQWFSVPSALNYMAKFGVVRQGDFPHLKRVLWCGEVFPTRNLIYWMERLPHVQFTNLYGPTETTIASSYYTLPRCPENEQVQIPIGIACPGESLHILDENHLPVKSGESGELYIGGAGLSAGYWKDSAKTRQAFIADPTGTYPDGRLYRTGDRARRGKDGLIYFLGRSDSLVKSRGYRIDLGEIETALRGLDCIVECAVVALPNDQFDGVTLSCAYVPAADAEVTGATLSAALQALLPRYMIPSQWKAFEELPKNTNGKIDRRALTDTLRLHAVVTDQHS